MSKENKYYFILTSWDDASRRSLWIYFRELPFDFFVGFSLMSRINKTKRGDFNRDSSPSAQWIQRRWSSAILCRELKGRETHAQRGRSIIKNSDGARRPFDVFRFFSPPEANSTFPPRSAGKQAETRFCRGRKSTQGKMHPIAVQKKPNELKPSDKGCRLLSARLVHAEHEDGWRAAKFTAAV